MGLAFEGRDSLPRAFCKVSFDLLRAGRAGGRVPACEEPRLRPRLARRGALQNRRSGSRGFGGCGWLVWFRVIPPNVG